MTYIFLRYTVHISCVASCMAYDMHVYGIPVILCAVRTAAYTACRRVIIFFCHVFLLSLGSVCLVTGFAFLLLRLLFASLCYCSYTGDHDIFKSVKPKNNRQPVD